MSSKRSLIRSIVFGFFIGLASISSFASTTSPPLKNTVVIALNDWASQRVLSQVVGRLFSEMGVEVKYQQMIVDDQWGAFRLGIIDVQIELWQGTSFKLLQESIGKGFVIDAGSHTATAREEWWYPTYVKPLCPGLPNWKALLSCSHVFSTQESAGRGLYFSGPWNPKEGARIRAFGLNFTIKRLSDDAALWRRLNQAIIKKEPIMLLNWTPNWTDSRTKGEFVEFPAYSDECITDPSWGINKSLARDCGNPKSGWVKKLASVRLKRDQPCAYSALTKIDFTTKMMSEAAALVIVDKYSEQDAVRMWVELFKPQWRRWFPGGCSVGSLSPDTGI